MHEQNANSNATTSPDRFRLAFEYRPVSQHVLHRHVLHLFILPPPSLPREK